MPHFSLWHFASGSHVSIKVSLLNCASDIFLGAGREKEGYLSSWIQGKNGKKQVDLLWNAKDHCVILSQSPRNQGYPCSITASHLRSLKNSTCFPELREGLLLYSNLQDNLPRPTVGPCQPEACRPFVVIFKALWLLSPWDQQVERSLKKFKK